jgi:hypothetical protein
MAYKTFDKQVESHIAFLRSKGLDVSELNLHGGFVRCNGLNQSFERDKFCYKTHQNKLQNGLWGLITWCRSDGAEESTYKTYGLPPSENQIISSKNNSSPNQSQILAARKAETFWNMSDSAGESDYLRSKKVGYHNIRFRQNKYGRVAVIPLRDACEKLWSYQLLNPDGSKRFPKECRTEGLHHSIGSLINGDPIGLAESYVVAATCHELLGIAAVTAFYANNLEAVALCLRERYSDSVIVVFGDNDLHLNKNKGLLAALSVQERSPLLRDRTQTECAQIGTICSCLKEIMPLEK